jgi:chaperonin GroES
MIYQPHADKILLEKWEPDRTTSGGILMPKGSEKEIGYGRVIGIGEGTKDQPMSVSVGDLVIFGTKYGCLPIDDMLIISHLSVIARCTEDGEDHKPKILAPAGKRVILGNGLN